jgi:hypothetical protein
MSRDELSPEFGKNSKTRKITIEDLKRYSEFKQLTDDEANEIIESLYQLSIITLNIYKDEFRSI